MSMLAWSILDHLRMLALHQHQRGEGVPQIVPADVELLTALEAVPLGNLSRTSGPLLPRSHVQTCREYPARRPTTEEEAVHVIVAALSAHATRRIFELGALLGILGGVVLAFVPRIGRRVAGLLLVACFVLLIFAVHFGKTL